MKETVMPIGITSRVKSTIAEAGLSRHTATIPWHIICSRAIPFTEMPSSEYHRTEAAASERDRLSATAQVAVTAVISAQVFYVQTAAVNAAAVTLFPAVEVTK